MASQKSNKVPVRAGQQARSRSRKGCVALADNRAAHASRPAPATSGTDPLPAPPTPVIWPLFSLNFFQRLSLALLLATLLRPGLAGDLLREQEIAQCLPGEIATWRDGQDRPAVSSPLVLVYRHAGAPYWFDSQVVLAALGNAAAAWSGCGVPAQVLSWPATAALAQGAVLVQWSEAGSAGGFGLADVGARRLSLGPAAFQLLRTRNPAFDARQTLQMVISHEMGHLFGLMAHSRRCVDVTSYYHNAAGEHCVIRGGGALPTGGEYRALLPTACDIQRCRLVNGQPAKP
jgi:hypothetical protein